MSRRDGGPLEAAILDVATNGRAARAPGGGMECCHWLADCVGLRSAVAAWRGYHMVSARRWGGGEKIGGVLGLGSSVGLFP